MKCDYCGKPFMSDKVVNRVGDKVFCCGDCTSRFIAENQYVAVPATKKDKTSKTSYGVGDKAPAKIKRTRKENA